jgi:hypothetical protein
MLGGVGVGRGIGSADLTLGDMALCGGTGGGLGGLGGMAGWAGAGCRCLVGIGARNGLSFAGVGCLVWGEFLGGFF